MKRDRRQRKRDKRQGQRDIRQGRGSRVLDEVEMKQEERVEVQPRSKGGIGYKGRGTRGKEEGQEAISKGQQARKRV